MLERGERLARADTIVKLAGALEVDPAELFEGIKWTPGEVRLGSFKHSDEAIELASQNDLSER